MNKRPGLAVYFVVATFLLVLVTLFGLSVSATSPDIRKAFGAPLADGELDTTFGTAGNVSTAFYVPFDSVNYASALQSDGKIVLAGSVGDGVESEINNFALYRINPDGTTDNSFGRGGSVETDFAHNEDRAQGVAIQADGKIIAAGYARMNCCSGNEDFALVRYNSDGSLDLSFSGDGKVNTNVGGSGDIIYAVKLQSDGKIVVAGTANNHFAIARYNSDGTLDTSFSGDGIAGTSMGSSDRATGLAIQSDGKIVLAGTAILPGDQLDIAVARFNTNGTLDTSFSSDGKVLTDISGGTDTANGVVMQAIDNRIVVVGLSRNASNTEQYATVIRYNTDGSLDTSFDGDGTVITELGDYGRFNSVVVQADNMIVAAGSSATAFTTTLALVRYTTTGVPDTGFDGDGIAETSFGNNSSGASGVLLRPSGTIIASGMLGSPDLFPHNGYAIAQYNINGSLDPSFSGDGKLTAFNMHSEAILSKVAVQADGKIVAAGTASHNIALARYTTDGALDAAFGTAGVVTTTGSLTTTHISAQGLTLQSDGKIITIGRGFDGAGSHVALVRYSTNGTLDPSFGEGGFVRTYIDPHYTSGVTVKQQIDGKIVALFGSTSTAVLVRYLANGTLDPTFGTGGIVSDNFGIEAAFADLALQADGKIVITGRAPDQTFTNLNLMIARYLSNGTADTSFGTNGRVLIDFGSTYEEAYTLAVQQDGKIIAGGYTISTPQGYVWAMARVNSNGALDVTFDGDGKLTANFADGEANQLYSLKLMADGRIIGGGNQYARVARFNSDGSLDPTFGTGGFVQNTAIFAAASLALQSDHKIVIGGDSYTGYTDRLFGLARYTNSLSTVTPSVIPSATPTSCAVGWRHVPWVGESGMRLINGVKAWASNNVWAVGTANQSTHVLHWDGAQWSVVPSPDIANMLDTLVSIDGASPNDMWAVGNSFSGSSGQTDPIAIHWNGSTWSLATLPSVSYADLRSVTAISANDVWAVGYFDQFTTQTFAIHWNGSTWSIVPTPNYPGGGGSAFTGVGAYSATDVWAVGNSSVSGLGVTLIEHWNGSTWSVVTSPNIAAHNNSLTGVTVAGSNDVWAVGTVAEVEPREGLIPPSESLLLHWDGTAWTRVASPNPASIVFMTGIDAVGQNDVWAVGFTYGSGPESNITLRWNGSTWQTISILNPSAYANRLWGISAISSNEAWAVGEFGQQFGGAGMLALHYQTCVTPSPSATASTPTGSATRTPTGNATSTRTPTGTTPTSTPTLSVISTSTATTGTTTTPTTTGSTATPTNITTATPTACTIQFTDVLVGSTFYDFVWCMACRGIINGYTSGCETGDPCFRPNNNVTRGQLSKIVANAAGFVEPTGAQQYEDVPPGSTFYDVIWRLAARGYVGGYPCGTTGEPCGPGNLPYFRPNGNATRGQISKIVSNAAGYVEPGGNQIFEDVAPGSTFYDFVQRLASRGVMSGYACGGPGEPCNPPDNRPYFRPSNQATRGQTSKIVSNTFFPACATP